MLESVILSVPYSHIQNLLKSGRPYAFKLKRLKSQISLPLSAILTVNTLANTFGAFGVGAQANRIFDNGFVVLFSVMLTFTILIFSEIIPKTLGANYWRHLLMPSVYIISFFIFICTPFVMLARWITQALGAKDASVTRDDIIGSSEVAAIEGSIYRNESELIKNILKLQDKLVSEIMTPRTVVTAFEKNMTIEEVIKKHQPMRFSRIPIYDGNLDQVVGLVHRYKILEASSQDYNTLTMKDFIKPVHAIPESISVTAAFDQFIKRKEHIFIVLDEYGTLSGLVTMEDVIETILGIEIVDELDSVADLREQALDQWKQKKRNRK